MSKEAQALADANRLLAAIGPKPAGSPADLFKLAKDLRAAAGDAQAFAGGIATTPRVIVFKGPAGTRFAENCETTRNAGNQAHNRLIQASESAHRDATKLQKAQDDWTRGREMAENAVEAARDAVNAVVDAISGALR